MDAVDYSNRVHNPNLPEYRWKKKLYEETKPIEQRMVQHDQMLEQAKGDAQQYAALAKHLLNDPPLLDATFQEQQLQNSHFQLSASEAGNMKMKNELDRLQQRKDSLLKQEKALDIGAMQSKVLAEATYRESAKFRDHSNTRERQIYINAASAQRKEEMVRKLSVAIYLLIYAMGLGVAMAIGIISPRALGFAFLSGALVAMYFVLTAHGSFTKHYGEATEKLVKRGVRGAIDVLGWQKKCPPRCKSKTDDKIQPPNDPSGVSYPNLPAQAYAVDEPDIAIKMYSKSFRDMPNSWCGQPFCCAWDSPQPVPNNQPNVLASKAPCSIYENRTHCPDQRLCPTPN